MGELRHEIIVQNSEKTQEIWLYDKGPRCLYRFNEESKIFEKNFVDFCTENINQVKVKGNLVAVATDSGLKLSEDGGRSFKVLVDGTISDFDTYDFKTFYYVKSVGSKEEFHVLDIAANKSYSTGQVYINGISTDGSLVGSNNGIYLFNGTSYIHRIRQSLSRAETLMQNFTLVETGGDIDCLLIDIHGRFKRIPVSFCSKIYTSMFHADFFYVLDQLDNCIKKFGLSRPHPLKEICISTRDGYRLRFDNFAISSDESRIILSFNRQIYFSHDGGLTIHPTSVMDEIKDILIDKTNSDNVLVVGLRGLYHSNDGGRTFVQKLSEPLTRIRQLPDGTILIFTKDKNYFYVSRDSGVTFKKLEVPYPYIITDGTIVSHGIYRLTTDYGVIEIKFE